MLTFAKRKLLIGSIAALVTAVSVNAAFYLGIFDEFELKTFDLRVKAFSRERKAPSDIAVILIDETSLRAMNPIVGRWPWPRSLHADLIEFLSMGGAKAVLFDILFTENERIPGEPPGTVGTNDMRLVEATEATGNIFNAAQLLVDVEDEYNKGLLGRPLPEDFVERFSVKGLKGIVAGPNNTYYIPFSELYMASKGIGIVEFTPDDDGIYRRTRLFRHYQGSFFPVLSTAPLMDILKPEGIRVENGNLILSPPPSSSPAKGEENTSHVSRLTSHVSIPLQKDGSYLVNMYSDFNPYSMSGILASIQKIKMGELEGLPVNPDEFRDKIVFVGASAVGVADLKPTPMGSRTPGVYLHASIYGNIVRNDFLRFTPPWITSFSVIALSFTVALAILWSRRTLYQMGLPFLMAFIYVSTSFWWFKKSIVFDMIPPLLSIVVSWMGAFAYLSFTEGKDKRKIKRMLSQYVSPTILATVVDRSREGVLRAEVGSKENLTVLFSDIRDFTTISESLDAEKVVELLNSHLSGMVDVIFRHEGTLDKFIGDAIMAFWGAPIKAGDHAKKAVETALEMIRRLESFNEAQRSRGLPALAIGVGINTGDVILGNIGSEKKLDYTVIGDNVNLASRMEGLTKEYGCPILITETTYEEVKDVIPCSVVDLVRVKGRKRPVKIYEPLGKTELNERIVSFSEEGFNYYLNREWEKANECYFRLLSLRQGDNVANMFIKRCEDYMANEPPDDWDGVYTMMKK
jgi:adenylate cyclase